MDDIPQNPIQTFASESVWKRKKNNFLFSYRNNATFTMYSEVMRLIGELKFVNILLGYDTTPGRQTTIFSNNSYNNLKQQNTTFRYF